MEPAASVDQPSDFGTDEQSKVSRWISEIELSDRAQKNWIVRAREICKRYTEDRQLATDIGDAKARRYSLLWSNIQTLAPAVYARTPTAVVGRRWTCLFLIVARG